MKDKSLFIVFTKKLAVPAAVFLQLILSYLLPGPLVAEAQNTIPNESEVYVQIQRAKIRQAPQQWATSVADVKFADKLLVLESKDSWAKVKTDSGLEGFLHLSAITQRKILLSASTDTLLNSQVDDSDVYLAGKGFNDDVLKAYAASDPKLDFGIVDQMQQQSAIEGEQLHSFIVEGHLQQTGAGL